MPFITGKHLPRRTVLRGLGASLALPYLDAMVPAGRFWRERPERSFTRLVCIEESMGAAGSSEWGAARHLFAPAGTGRDYELAANSQLTPLTDFRSTLTIVSNTDCRPADAYAGEEIGGDHDRSTAVFLTQVRPRRTRGPEVQAGTSLDQLHARRVGHETALPSLELCVEEPARDGDRITGYHRAYRDSLAWAAPNRPLPSTREPRLVFDRLFGTAAAPGDRASAQRAARSVIDRVARRGHRLRRALGPTDRLALDHYMDRVREVERRIQLVESRASSRSDGVQIERPSSVPESFEEHMRLMFDLQLLALQSDLTRVITFKTGVDRSSRTFPASGTSTPLHEASHHEDIPVRILAFNRINAYRLGQLAYFLRQMRETVDGDASLLDKTAIIWGSPMGDGNRHDHRRVPLLLLGRANGALAGGLHLRAPEGTPMANVLLALMQRIGHPDLTEFGDSTGTFRLDGPIGT